MHLDLKGGPRQGLLALGPLFFTQPWISWPLNSSKISHVITPKSWRSLRYHHSLQLSQKLLLDVRSIEIGVIVKTFCELQYEVHITCHTPLHHPKIP